jgi:hypothetical protein
MDQRSICLFLALKGLSARDVDNELVAVLGPMRLRTRLSPDIEDSGSFRSFPLSPLTNRRRPLSTA